MNKQMFKIKRNIRIFSSTLSTLTMAITTIIKTITAIRLTTISLTAIPLTTISLLLLTTLPLLTVSCSGKMTSKDRNRESDFSRKIKETVEKNRENQSTSPIILTSRKLTLDEIANHLDMDVETAILHLKSTNVHGYFSLSAKNLPTSGEFILYHVALDGKITPSKTFFVNGNGILVTQMDDVYVDLGNSFLFFSDYLAGEPADFVLASKDGKIFSAVHIIPNPIQVMDVKGRKLSVEVISPNKKEFLVNCTGCRPRQTYFINARFENERLGYEAVANQFGEILQKVGPTAPWMTGGDASIELHGDEIEHPLAVEFQWGGSEV